MDKKALVITPTEFTNVLTKFLDTLKEKQIVANYMINKNERIVTIDFNPDAKVPETKEDLITKGLFRNVEKILIDLGYEDVHMKTVQLPIYTIQEINDNRIVINY